MEIISNVPFTCDGGAGIKGADLVGGSMRMYTMEDRLTSTAFPEFKSIPNVFQT